MPAPDGPPHDLPRLIKVLAHHQVECLIVGGAAAYAYGERPTDDADFYSLVGTAPTISVTSAPRPGSEPTKPASPKEKVPPSEPMSQ